MKAQIVCILASLAIGVANASWMTEASKAQSARLSKIDAQYQKVSNSLTAKYGIKTSTYKKLAAKSTSALNYNRLANSIKYNHGYSVKAIYAGYHPYTTRAVKGVNYQSLASLARIQLAKVKYR